MKRLLFGVFLALGACAAPAPAQRKMDIQLRNPSPVAVEVRAKAGPFARTIRLKPGETWSGWIPTFVTVKQIDIEITVPPQGH